ncbi:hypothetical protein ACP70R_003413 [Stipagrostis hirtigluma subsp. patula]
MELKGAELLSPAKKTSFLQEEEEAAMAAASSSAVFSFLELPLSLLRHVAHACAGYLRALSGPRPGTAAADACEQGGAAAGNDNDDEEAEEEVVVVEVRPRRTTGWKPPPPPERRTRELTRQGPGRDGGPHH